MIPLFADYLSHLMKMNAEAVRGYQHASVVIGSPELAERMLGFRDDHRRQTEELAAAIRELGAAPPVVDMDISRVMKEGFEDIPADAGTLEVLQAMEFNEDLVWHRYRQMAEGKVRVLGGNMPGRLLDMARRHLATENTHLDFIRTELENLYETVPDWRMPLQHPGISGSRRPPRRTR